MNDRMFFGGKDQFKVDQWEGDVGNECAIFKPRMHG
jgi:hypothetical protein